MAAPSTASHGGILCSHSTSTVPQPFHLYGGAYSSGGLVANHLIPQPSLCGGEGSSFPACVPVIDMVDSEFVMGIKPGESGLGMWYHVDEFTCIWLVEYSFA